MILKVVCTGLAINAGKIFTLIAGWIYRRQMGLLTAEAENAIPPNSRRLHGDLHGLTVLDCAVDQAYEALEQRGIYGRDDTYALINMPKLGDPEEILECSDDEEQGEDWLKDMLISAEIVSIQPKP